MSLTSNFSASNWSNIKSKDRFEILRTSRFQNWPYFLSLVKIWGSYCQKTNKEILRSTLYFQKERKFLSWHLGTVFRNGICLCWLWCHETLGRSCNRNSWRISVCSQLQVDLIHEDWWSSGCCGSSSWLRFLGAHCLCSVSVWGRDCLHCICWVIWEIR